MRLGAALLAALACVACGGAAPTPPAAPVTSEASEATFVAALRERVQAAAATDQFSGAVLVARDGRTLFEGAYGRADRERGVPNTILTQFRVGSMNKMITAV